MEKTIITSGKTVDAAIDAALATLGMERDNVSVQILQQAKSGFLGFGAQPAKVQVTYEVPDEPKKEAPKSALGSASRSKTTHTATVAQAPEAPKPQPKKEEPKPQVQKEEPTNRPARQERRERPARPERPERPERKVEAPKAEPKVYAPAEAGSVEEKIEQFINGLLQNMNSDAKAHCLKGEDATYNVELVGEDLGYLIGRRGDTLDAIQHLTNYSVNRNVEGHIRVNVDAEQYRAKREDSLRKYARKKALQVLKAHRRTTLEPMNAYERHIIHAALQDMDNITTYSTGTEPNRRVVIEYVR